MGKVIHWELYKRLKFENNKKCYMHQESHLENKTPQIFCYFQIQTDQPILAKRSNLVLINKKKRTCYIVDFEIQTDCLILARRPNLVLINKKKELVIKWILQFQQITRVKTKENERGQILGSCLRAEKTMELEDYGDYNSRWYA